MGNFEVGTASVWHRDTSNHQIRPTGTRVVRLVRPRRLGEHEHKCTRRPKNTGWDIRGGYRHRVASLTRGGRLLLTRLKMRANKDTRKDPLERY